MPFVLSTSDAASRSASTEEEYRLSESADATMAKNYGEENAFSTAAYDMVTKISQNVVNARTIDGIPDGELKDRQVSTALKKMRRDVISLDALASSRSPQLALRPHVGRSSPSVDLTRGMIEPKAVDLHPPTQAGGRACAGYSSA